MALLAAGVCLLMSVSNRHFLFDDAYLFINYASHLATEGKWSLNGLAISNGVTSPLYTLLLASAAWLGKVDAEKASVYINSFLWMLWGGSTYFLIRCFIKNQLVSLVGALFVVTHPFYGIVYRMETHLVLTGSVLAALAYARRAYVLLGLATGLTFLARPDSVLFLLPLYICLFFENRRAWLRAALWPALPVIPWLIYSERTFGKLLPDTLTAKISQGQSGFWELFWPGFVNIWLVIFHQTPVTVILLICLAIALFIQLGKPILKTLGISKRIDFEASHLDRHCAHLRWSILIYLVAYCVIYSAILRVPNYHWYYAAPIFWTFILCIMALGGITYSKSWKAFLLPALCLVAVIGQWMRNETLLFNEAPNLASRRDYAAIGNFLRQNTHPGATVAAAEVGVLSWFARRSIIDALGLGDPELSQKIASRDVGYWLRRRQPDYLLFQGMIFNMPTPYHQWLQVPWFTRAYQLFKTFDFEGRKYEIYQKVADADSVIAALQTEQCRLPFCLDRGDDAYVFGASKNLVQTVLSAPALAILPIREYKGLRPVPGGNYEASDSDPWLIMELKNGLPVALAPDRHLFLRIRATLSGKAKAARDVAAALYVATAQFPIFSEENSMRLRAYLDSKEHSYFLPLALVSGWVKPSELRALRFDPLDCLGKVSIHSIELCAFPPGL